MSAQTIPEDVFAGIELLGHGDRAELERKLADQSLHILWNTATTNRPHIGYLIPLLSLVKLLNKGARVTILLADIHSSLDEKKLAWETLESQAKHCEALLTSTFKNLDTPMDRVKFVRGSDFQLSREYMLDVHRLASLVTEDEAAKAGVDVVAQVKHPTVGGLLYPILHTLDEEFSKADVQFGGTDQRALFEFSEKYLPILSYSKRIHIMHKPFPGLIDDLSNVDSKIDLLDSSQTVSNKISKVTCLEGDINNNRILDLARHVIFPIHKKVFVERPEGFGGPLTYDNFQHLEADFAARKLHPIDLTSAIESHICRLLSDVQKILDHPDKPAAAKVHASTKTKSLSQGPPPKHLKTEHQVKPSEASRHDSVDMETSEKVKLIIKYLQEVVGQEKHESLVRERNVFLSKLSHVITDLETANKLSDQAAKANLQTRVTDVTKHVVTYDQQLREELEKRPKLLVILNNFISNQKTVLRESEKNINFYKAKFEAVTRIKRELVSQSSADDSVSHTKQTPHGSDQDASTPTPESDAVDQSHAH